MHAPRNRCTEGTCKCSGAHPPPIQTLSAPHESHRLSVHAQAGTHCIPHAMCTHRHTRGRSARGVVIHAPPPTPAHGMRTRSAFTHLAAATRSWSRRRAATRRPAGPTADWCCVRATRRPGSFQRWRMRAAGRTGAQKDSGGGRRGIPVVVRGHHPHGVKRAGAVHSARAVDALPDRHARGAQPRPRRPRSGGHCWPPHCRKSLHQERVRAPRQQQQRHHGPETHHAGPLEVTVPGRGVTRE